ncbi:MAG TPA: methyltransferase domain-containing protein [Rhodopila sp.]|nr:methyltransferase domain-containing protein [Rhodopila sp.]
MDTDCVDYDDYARCLRDLSRVNVVTLTHRPMLRWIARRATPGFSVLDVACGHGDALRAIRRRYPDASLTGVDLNPWATQAARAASTDANITFVNGDAFAYAPAAEVDFIISSQFTHHLTDDQVVAFLIWLHTHARRGWFISDLHRHAIPYYCFPLLARTARWHRFVREDGRISITRAFIRAEWEALLDRAGLTGQATISWHLPFRLCVSSL